MINRVEQVGRVVRLTHCMIVCFGDKDFQAIVKTNSDNQAQNNHGKCTENKTVHKNHNHKTNKLALVKKKHENIGLNCLMLSVMAL